MKKNIIRLMILVSLIGASSMVQATRYRDRICNKRSCVSQCTPCASACAPCFCNSYPYCGPFPRPLPGDYESFKDNTKINFWYLPPCGPRNDSQFRGYLYKGMWWDTKGVRYWAIRNKTNNTITVQGLEGGESKDIPAGDVVNIGRGESYTFRVQAPARRFELFNSDEHNIDVFINIQCDIRYRVEPKPVKFQPKVYNKGENLPILPKF